MISSTFFLVPVLSIVHFSVSISVFLFPFRSLYDTSSRLRAWIVDDTNPRYVSVADCQNNDPFRSIFLCPRRNSGIGPSDIVSLLPCIYTYFLCRAHTICDSFVPLMVTLSKARPCICAGSRAVVCSSNRCTETTNVVTHIAM